MGTNVYQIVTDRIISQLNQGIIPWKKPWLGYSSGAFNRITKRPYSLLNQMLLSKKGEYASFKQWTQMGGRIRKGASSEIVVFWKLLQIKDADYHDEKPGEEVIQKIIPILRYYRVFHISDVEGIEPLPLENENSNKISPILKAQEMINEYVQRENINLIEEQGDKAAYSPAEDQITLPLMEQFISAEEFYATAFHEMVHSTCQENRCNRLINTNPFSKEYAKEELIAEIGAAFLLNFAGIEHDETEKNNVSYIQAWLRHLQDDNRFIISASGKAEKAVEYIQHGNQKEEEVIAA